MSILASTILHLVENFAEYHSSDPLFLNHIVAKPILECNGKYLN